MTAQDMLDYVFHQMDESTRDSAEREMESDPALNDRINRLGRSVAQLVDDGEDYLPPPSLAAKTLALVEHRKTHPQVADFMPTRVPFRMADFAVAATVFFAAVFTLSVPLLRSRAQMDQSACAFNLGKLGVSLANYRNTFGAYPLVPVSYPAGTYGVMLQDKHTLTDPGVLLCPCTQRAKSPSALPDFATFSRMLKEDPRACRELIDGHFAYNVGYQSPRGGDELEPPSIDADHPIASDGPQFSHDGTILDGNSPNHGGHGQNVLFGDGRVSFRRNRWISQRDRDLYLNESRLAAPGIHQHDSTLMPSVLPTRVR